MTPRVARRWLLAVLGLGLLVRLLHFATIASTAYPEIPRFYVESDMHASLGWAERILAGDWLGRDTYHPYFIWMQAIAPLETWHRWWGGKEVFQQAPLYTYWLAGALGVSGGSLGFALLAQLLVGALQPLAVYALARRIFDARVGLAAAALAALHGPLVFQQGTHLRDWIVPLVEPLALVLLLRAREGGRVAGWVGAGAVLGVAVLAKETALLFVPVAALWAAWPLRRAGRRALATAGALAAGVVLALSPLVARNAIVGAPLVSLSNRAAESIIIGHAVDGHPLANTRPASMGAILDRSQGRLLRVVTETLQGYEGRWGELAWRQVLRLRGLLDPLETADNLAFSYGLEISPVLRGLLRYGLLLPLALAGLVVSLNGWRGQALLLLHGLTTVVALMSSIVIGRYRLALVPVLVVYAAAGLVRAADAARARRGRRVAGYVLLVAAAAGLQQVAGPVPELRSSDFVVVHRVEYLIAAEVYARRGEFARALEELARLRARAMARPGAFDRSEHESWRAEGGVRLLWATRLLADGRPEEATRQIEQAEAAYTRGAPDWLADYNIGVLALRLGDRARAAAAFGRFLASTPEGPEAERARRWLARYPGADR